MPGVDVAYLVSHGFAARMVLHSTLVQEATARGLSVAVIAPVGDDPGLERLAKSVGAVLERGPDLARRGALAGELRPYLFEDVRRNPALWAKHLRAAADPRTRWRAKLRLALNGLVRNTPGLLGRVDALDRALVRSAEARALLRRLSPRLVVATYPVHPMEAAMLVAARDLGLRTVGHLLSWDNLTTKGRFTVLPDDWIAWGPVMAAELKGLYGVAPERIREVGVPHFDAHVGAATPDRRTALLRRLGLDPARPYVLFGMSAPYFCPTEIDIVEWLAARIAEGRFGADLQLVVRPHPQNVTGNLADLSWLPRIDALRGPRVAVDLPTMEPGGLSWSLDPADLPHMATLVGGAVATLNSGSTLAIDALVHDRPVILTPFDTVDDLPWWKSARRIASYPHLVGLIRTGGVRVTRSLDELGRALDTVLANPDDDVAGRRAARHAELFAVDGRAAARAAEALRALMDAS